MFKKIFSMLFVCLTLFATNAFAAVEPTKCFDEKEGYVNGDNGIIAHYVIYFKNASYQIENINGHDCKQELKDLFDPIFTNSENFESVLLLGSADNTANEATDANYAKRREETIRKFLTDSAPNGLGYDIPVCDSTNSDRTPCANLSMGHTIQKTLNVTESTPKTRGVYVFILYKRTTCNESITQAFTGLEQQLTERLSQDLTSTDPNVTALREALESAKQICNEDKHGQYILPTDQDKITAVWLAASKIPGMKINGNIAIESLAQSIKNTFTGLGLSKSVWKDKQGDFNYSRLISDSIAGVVLGTAGGLITSHIVKKNQISSGFENIMCTIGGQSVASYGDEFSVGIQHN